MNRFIIKITPEYKGIVSQYGKIIFDSQLIEGLVGIETELPFGEMWKIPHVIKVECDRTGTFNS